MWKKIVIVGLLILIFVGLFIGWRFFMSNTNFDEKSKYFYIRTGDANYQAVYQSFSDSNFVKNPSSFNQIANRMEVWNKLRPGKYEIKKGMSLFEIAKMFRNGKQAPVNLTITKIRTREQLAGMIGRRFECDSAAMIRFMTNTDSLKEFGLDSNIVMTAVFPNTYTYLWNSTPSNIFSKLYAEHKKVWTAERRQLAQQHGLNPATTYILASIIEEETNLREDKGNMASVYMNRMSKGIKLGADPTVKFALKDFSLKRIYEKHTAVESPYNTYRNFGLPPGPICTPSLETIDEVLHSPSTNYLFFVAKSDFSQRHVFTETYADHLKYAKEYHKALDQLIQKKQAAKEDTGE
ncbi:MAG: endolytic transglycosylase MltG [Chitinophagaceae bacterium]|nr:endolytic transglycosylase MltG [Chitinophagaceae bacterium]